MSAKHDKAIRLGHVSGVHGIKGWVKVHSFTEPRANIIKFDTWMLELAGRVQEVAIEHGEAHGKGVLAKLAGVEDRDQAGELVGATISVSRRALPACAPGEYYWADLEGLAVHDQAGNVLGNIDRMLGTGAHDVMVLGSGEERLIPFVRGKVVVDVDLEAGVVVVNWDKSFWDP